MRNSKEAEAMDPLAMLAIAALLVFFTILLVIRWVAERVDEQSGLA
jgi:hypothetical protein